MRKCPTCARTYAESYARCLVDGAWLYDPEAIRRQTLSYITNSLTNTWQTSFWHTVRVMSLLIVALVMIGIGLLLSEGDKPHPIFTLIAYLLTYAFLFAFPIFFIVTVIRLFRMPFEDKLKTLSIIFAAIGLVVVYFSIVLSIYFDKGDDSLSTKLVAIIICLSLSAVFWAIGKKFESEPQSEEEQEEERQELIRSLDEAIAKNSKVGGWRK